VATVFSSGPRAGARTGSRLLWRAGTAPFTSNIDDEELAFSLADSAKNILASGTPATRIFNDGPQRVAVCFEVDESSSAAAMHHNYRHDLAALRALLFRPIPYLGILGPKHRTLRLLADLAASGSVVTKTQMARLYKPVGLDLGAESPEEVALAIVAEMKAVLAGRDGGPLRERSGALHERVGPMFDPAQGGEPENKISRTA
jgi:xanthine/CO dehydrogenase XdhC/CoxF family maturation factor